MKKKSTSTSSEEEEPKPEKPLYEKHDKVHTGLTQLSFNDDAEVSSETEHDLLFKVILVGESGVGKSNLYNRYMKGSSDEDLQPTIGIEWAYKAYKIEDKIVKIQIWDTAGQERYRAMTRQYYRGAHGAVLVYDITRKQTFQELESWIQEVKNSSGNPDIEIILVGNKCDLTYARVVSTKDGLDFAESHKTSFLETSAKDNTNVTTAFHSLYEDIYRQRAEQQQQAILDTDVENLGEDLSSKGTTKIPKYPSTGLDSSDGVVSITTIIGEDKKSRSCPC